MKIISGNIVDLISGRMVKGDLYINGTKIEKIAENNLAKDQFIIPGFVDAHIHIESSMMLPAEFARFSTIHGTVACVCDPHEIANVCGVEGIDYMIENGKKSPMKFFFGAPSCVPSTHFETSGAELNVEDVKQLLERQDIYFLAEMMNYPGVIHKNKQVIGKIEAAMQLNKPIDGHAPELSGDDLKAYAMAGISTDHECMSVAEAEAKIALGMKVQIREGSAAKNFDDLLPLLEKHRDNIMFCSDDKHPDDLLRNGHVNALAKRAVAAGYDAMDVLRVCSLNPIRHYGLNVGLLQPGDDADFIVVNDLNDFEVKETYIRGEKVAENGAALFERYIPKKVINKMNVQPITAQQLQLVPSDGQLRVITVEDGQLFTTETYSQPLIEENNIVSDLENDVLKMVVYNRYQPSKPAIGFIRNIGLKRGALASTVAHDSHNIVAVGTSDAEIVLAVNRLIEKGGGVLASSKSNYELLSLPVGGLMSDADGLSIAQQYEKTDAMAKELGTKLHAPFMTLAFMSLLVIPEIKLGDKGLFDGRTFSFVDLIK